MREEQYEALKNHKACQAGTKNIKGRRVAKNISICEAVKGLKLQHIQIVKNRRVD